MTPHTTKPLASGTDENRPEPGVLHATLRSIAARARRVDGAQEVDRCEARALAQTIRRVRSGVQGHFGAEIGHWLDNLQARVDRISGQAPLNC